MKRGDAPLFSIVPQESDGVQSNDVACKGRQRRNCKYLEEQSSRSENDLAEETKGNGTDQKSVWDERLAGSDVQSTCDTCQDSDKDCLVADAKMVAATLTGTTPELNEKAVVASDKDNQTVLLEEWVVKWRKAAQMQLDQYKVALELLHSQYQQNLVKELQLPYGNAIGSGACKRQQSDLERSLAVSVFSSGEVGRVGSGARNATMKLSSSDSLREKSSDQSYGVRFDTQAEGNGKTGDPLPGMANLEVTTIPEAPRLPERSRNSTWSLTSDGTMHTKRSRSVRVPGSEAKRAQWEEHQRQNIVKMVSRTGASPQRKWMRDMVSKLKPPAVPDNILSRITQGRAFMVVTACVILFNAIMIGIETDESMKNSLNGSEDPVYFGIMNRCFTGFFVVELSLRMLGEQWWFFVGPEWKWNLFDVLLVVQSLIMEVLEGSNMSFARILRAFRMVRAARVIRVLRFFHELRRMVCSIIASLMSLVWAFMLLALIIYLVAILFTQAVSNYIQDGNVDNEALIGIRRWYSSLSMAMYSLMLAISGGADWFELADPLTKISSVYAFAFTLYVFFVIFGVLNVLVGVFLASASEMLDRDIIVQSELMKTNSAMKNMMSLFQDIDKNNNGVIGWIEFEEYLKDEKAQAFFQYNCLDTTDPYSLFALMDNDGDGQVDSQEFIMAMMKIKGQAKGSDVLFLIQEQLNAKEELQDMLRQLMLQVQLMKDNKQGRRFDTSASHSQILEEEVSKG